MKNTLFAASTMILFLNFANLTKEARAQDCWLGVKAGLSIPDLKGGTTPQSVGYTSRTGPDFGLLAYKNLSEHFALQAELSYVSQGGVKKGIQVLDPAMLTGISVPPGISLYARFKNKAIMNYLELPLLAKYSFKIFKTHLLYVDAGPNFGYLLNAKTKTSGKSQIFIDQSGTPLTIEGQPLPEQDFTVETDIRNDLKKINIGITGGVGVSRTFGPGDLILDLRGSYGFTNVQKDPANGKNNTGCLVISLGYAIPL
jgi:hypothetical protein